MYLSFRYVHIFHRGIRGRSVAPLVTVDHEHAIEFVSTGKSERRVALEKILSLMHAIYKYVLMHI